MFVQYIKKTVVGALVISNVMVGMTKDATIQKLKMSTYCQNCDVSGADLSGAQLPGRHISRSIFVGTNFSKASLQGSTTDPDKLIDTVPLQAQQGANFSKANFTDTNLKYVKFEGSNFDDAQFVGADLESADLKNSSFRNVNFKGADLSNVDFEGANLMNVDFTGANLEGANFKMIQKFDNVNFSHANLRNVQGFDWVTSKKGVRIIYNNTTMPNGSKK